MAHAALKAEVEAAVREAVAARQGDIAGVAAAPIVAAFAGKGAATSTLFKWVARYLASGDALTRVAGPPALLAPEAPASVDGLSLAPSPPTSPESVPARGIAVLDALGQCIEAAQQVMAHSRKDDGSIRNAKLLIGASEHLRRNLETAVRLRESMRQDRDLDLFLDEVIREIEKESPAVAARLLQRLNDLLLLRGA